MSQPDATKPMRASITVGEVIYIIDQRIEAAQAESKRVQARAGAFDTESRLACLKLLGEIEGLSRLRLEIAYPET